MLKITPEVQADSAFKAKVLESLKAKYEKERAGIHATDLLWPRQAVFRKLQGSKITERDVVFFAIGTGEGEAIEELMSGRREVVAVHNGVIHTIDSVVAEGYRLIPVEIKTTRASPPSVRKHYLLQLGMYCLALHVSHGKLAIFYLNDGVMETYNASYPAESLRQINRFEIEKRGEMLLALKTKDPMRASCVAGDPELDWKCLTCEYWERCCGERTSFRTDFPHPLMAGRSYEGNLIQEAHKASEHGCNVRLLRNQAGEITGVEASGDAVKLVPLRRATEGITARLTRG